ncbi:DsrE/DsrF/DrsH-like family protein [Paenisporosarcina sp. TG-14]|uniref:DsrE/DsrF/DrsH-like family protein n=1 Tax=Paenisporosarcina sp. TG-14 TaxID=1231057 RepID=UPI0002FD614E|nr:DsrE/DsrF/DrsH-like family protein [Paenisporosarcina sp. TG-14]
MANKKFIYFVSLSSNATYVLKQSLEMVKQHNEVVLFFDLDGARVLDQRYLKKLDRTHGTDLALLLKLALESGIKLYGCQMNVLIADGLELVDGAELAGVVTFLELAYTADAVLSY